MLINIIIEIINLIIDYINIYLRLMILPIIFYKKIYYNNIKHSIILHSLYYSCTTIFNCILITFRSI